MLRRGDFKGTQQAVLSDSQSTQPEDSVAYTAFQRVYLLNIDCLSEACKELSVIRALRGSNHDFCVSCRDLLQGRHMFHSWKLLNGASTGVI